jgi:hypothetical protein
MKSSGGSASSDAFSAFIRFSASREDTRRSIVTRFLFEF